MESLLRSIIPTARITALEKALLEVFNTITITEIAPLAGGLSNAVVYKIVVNDKAYILKLNDPVNAQLDGENQPTCMEVAALAGIAPPVYYLNLANGISIVGFINQVPLQAVFPSSDMLVQKLAKTIHTIHALPLFTKERNLLETIDGLINEFRASKMLLGPAFDECYHYYEVMKEHYPWHDADMVSSHNDLNPGNMICDGQKIWVIDWDAAFKNDRYVDLAIVANFFIRTPIQEKLFLEAYFGNNLDDYHSARFFIMRQICSLVYAIMMFKLADAAKPPGLNHDPDMQKANLKEVGEMLNSGKLQLSTYQGQLLMGKALLNEMLKNTRSSRFDLSINILEGVEPSFKHGIR